LAQYFVIVSIVIAGCSLTVIIGFIINIYRKRGTLDTKILKLGD
jgi:NADH:ubiquinone oxidoreductase subunit K